MISAEYVKAAGKRPTVSIVMANHNGATYLTESIGTALRQSLRNIEIIVSDDASTDDSVEIIERLRADDSRIFLIKSERNRGPAAARNRAIEVATGEWIAVMDSDDAVHPDRLAVLVEAALRDGADIAADDLVEFESDYTKPSRRLLSGRWARAAVRVDIVDYIRLNRIYGPGPALGYLKPLFRASLFQNSTVRYDEALWIAEDYDLVLRLLFSGKSLSIYPFPFYYYRKHHTSTSHRLNEGALTALRVAQIRFLEQIPTTNPRLATVVQTGIGSINTALAFERLLCALKARSWLDALSIALTQPRAAALLRLPIAVRLRRLLRIAVHRMLATQALNAAITTSPHDHNGSPPPESERIQP